jgi:hypothetical protein
MTPTIKEVSFVVDEQIWGHRLYDEQLPHLAVLEFFNVLQSNQANPLREPTHGRVRYRPQHQVRLRNILFNNPYIEIVRASAWSDEAKWARWVELFREDATDPPDRYIGELKRRFTSFDDFARAVELLRTSAFEGQSNKRWSSRFVFPFGPAAMYEDLRFDASGNSSNDRRFFARTGELLYLMLSRATRGAQLGEELVQRMFKTESPMNRLVASLQGPPHLAEKDKEVGYLPLTKAPRFDRLCDDWLAVLSRDMPLYDGLDHLITITGLNLLLYFLEQARDAIGSNEPVELLCEIVSKQRTKVRALSIACFQTNQGMSVRAIEALIQRFKSTPAWLEALASDDPKGNCAALVREHFQYEKDDEVLLTNMAPNELLGRLLERAHTRHEQHVGRIHGTWSRALGLSSRRLSRRLRYAPSDRLLKALVVTVVDDTMEYSQFLAEIYRRYGIVVGHLEGARYIESHQVDQAALMDNAAHLETRLLGLGLVRRLSDSCAFVENPFTRRGAQ